MKKIEVFKMYTKKELIESYRRGVFTRDELDEKIEIREGTLRAEIVYLNETIKLWVEHIKSIEKNIEDAETKLRELNEELHIIF